MKVDLTNVLIVAAIGGVAYYLWAIDAKKRGHFDTPQQAKWRKYKADAAAEAARLAALPDCRALTAQQQYENRAFYLESFEREMAHHAVTAPGWPYGTMVAAFQPGELPHPCKGGYAEVKKMIQIEAEQSGRTVQELA